MREGESRAGGSDKKRWGDGRVAFFALMPQIALGLARKEPKSRIYERHKEALKVSYRQFVYLTHEYRDELNARMETLGGSDSGGSQAGRVTPTLPAAAPPRRSHSEQKPGLAQHDPGARGLPGGDATVNATKPAGQSSGQPEKRRDFHYDPMDAYRFKFD
jgi:hypothetical protein